jgi:hypothetical protein
MGGYRDTGGCRAVVLTSNGSDFGGEYALAAGRNKMSVHLNLTERR